MKRSKKLMGLTAVIMGVVMATAACGSFRAAQQRQRQLIQQLQRKQQQKQPAAILLQQVISTARPLMN